MKMKLFTITISFLLMMSGFFVIVSGEDTGLSVEEDESEPIEIYDWHDLDDVREDLDGDYILMNNLDEDTDGYDELVGTENGWEPIGDFGDRFTGTFDGNENEISDIYIDRPDTDDIGLFGTIGGEVRNVGVVDADVSGDSHVGGLVGWNYDGTVSNSYATGDVSGGDRVGGLVGMNWHTADVEYCYATGDVSGDRFVGGLMGSSDTVENSHASGEVIGNESVGGLVGLSDTVENSYASGDVIGNESVGGLVGSSVTVENSYATGDVIGNESVGGLVGLSDTVENSYAVGNVSGNEKVGGLVGWNFEDEEDEYANGTVLNSYSTGTVIGEEKVGGLVGYNDLGTVENSFWNIETSGQNESDGGEGKTTEEMINKETYTDEGWDLEDTWDIIEKETYPFLQWQDEDSYPYAPELEEDDDGIPGFTMPLLAIAVVVALVVYYKKKW